MFFESFGVRAKNTFFRDSYPAGARSPTTRTESHSSKKALFSFLVYEILFKLLICCKEVDN